MSAHKRDRSINIKVNILDEFKTLLTECKASIETRYDICNIYYQLFNYVQIQMVNSINLVDLLFYQQVQSIVGTAFMNQFDYKGILESVSRLHLLVLCIDICFITNETSNQ